MGRNKRLRLKGATKIQIAYLIGNRNEASSFSFSLVDTDGSENSFNIPLSAQPVGQPLAAIIDLNAGHEDKPGLNLDKLKTWQIKGNYQDKPVELLIIRVDTYHE